MWKSGFLGSKIDDCSQNWPMRSILLFLKTLCERAISMYTKRTSVSTALCLYIAQCFVHVRGGMRRKGDQRICFCKWEADQEQVLLSGTVRPTTGHGSNSRLPSGPAESVCSCSSEGRNLTPTQTLLSPHTVTLSSLLPTLFTCLRTCLFSAVYSKTYFSFFSCFAALVWLGLLYEVPRSDSGHTTLGRTLEKWSARRIDLYMTTRNIHNGQRSMPEAGFEPAVPASVRPQTLALDRSHTGIGKDVG